MWQYNYEEWGVAQADNYLNEMSELINKLALSPKLGRSADDILAGIRKIHFRHHLVLYQTSQTKLEIVSVLHERMDVADQELD
ncbi:type II toxin-antitoxin system RelE/ParE family toxin [Marinomonas shanghaiensis]|uniref:type II toxin-antitoxin system RelE/ParE family toxin n=1 Tax=Marinomonas shanghaiensis TaxID=2202418 RepID=UPI003A8D08D7